jgi:hypothetical protein
MHESICSSRWVAGWLGMLAGALFVMAIRGAALQGAARLEVAHALARPAAVQPHRLATAAVATLDTCEAPPVAQAN